MKIKDLKTRIMVFGTFDILHKGHLNLFKQSRRLAPNPFLIVSVARDKNVKKIKGKAPLYKERSRLAAVNTTKLVDRAVLGGVSNHLPHILKEKPDIIALGYDQTAYVKGLKTELAKRGLRVKVKRLKSHKPHIYKSSLLKDRG